MTERSTPASGPGLLSTVARLEELEKAASEPPWECTGNTFYVRQVSREKPGKENFEYFVMPGNSVTAALIAESRNALPALLDAVKKAAALVDAHDGIKRHDGTTYGNIRQRVDALRKALRGEGGGDV